MSISIKPTHSNSNDFGQEIEEYLLASPTKQIPASKKKKLISKVLAMIAKFVQAIRAGGVNAVTARRRLLDVIAIIISLGLDASAIIQSALMEAKCIFEICFQESIDISTILGISILDSVSPSSLMFITVEELKSINPEAVINVTQPSIVNTILMQSKIKASKASASKGNTSSSTAAEQKKVANPSKVNFMQGDDVAAIMNLPYYQEDKKKKVLH